MSRRTFPLIVYVSFGCIFRLNDGCIDIELVLSDTRSVETCRIDAETGLLLLAVASWLLGWVGRSAPLLRRIQIIQMMLLNIITVTTASAQREFMVMLKGCQIGCFVAIGLLETYYADCVGPIFLLRHLLLRQRIVRGLMLDQILLDVEG